MGHWCSLRYRLREQAALTALLLSATNMADEKGQGGFSILNYEAAMPKTELAEL